MYRPDIAGTKVAVRYDPFNAGSAYAYLGGEWVRCTSEYYTTFNNRTEQELQIAREELQASFRRYGREVRTVNAKLLADFLAQTATSERLLRQRLCDNAMDSVHTAIAHGSQLDEISPSVRPDQDAGEVPGTRTSFDHLILPEDF